MSDRSDHGPHLVVIGQMGVGKSTTGRALAEALEWSYADSDDDLVRLTGTTGADYASRFGVGPLHRLEAYVLLGALLRTEPHVITAAASIVENPLVREILPGRAYVARLHLDVAETRRRQASGGHRRPMSTAELEHLVHKREPHLLALQDWQLDAGRPTSELVAFIIRRLANPETFRGEESPSRKPGP